MRSAEYWRAYHRRWRRAHRSGENARKARWRSIPGWRAAHEPERRIVYAPIPALHTGHALFELARLLVRPSSMTILHDPLPDDLMSEAVLALLEGRDPGEAVARYARTERVWQRKTYSLPEWR